MVFVPWIFQLPGFCILAVWVLGLGICECLPLCLRIWRGVGFGILVVV